MNDDQDATRSMQREIISILTAASINPEEATDHQLLATLKKVFITADDERVKNALQKNKNLKDKVEARKTLALKSAALLDAQTSLDDVTLRKVIVNSNAVAVCNVRPMASGGEFIGANSLPSNAVSFLYSTAKNSLGFESFLLDFWGYMAAITFSLRRAIGS